LAWTFGIQLRRFARPKIDPLPPPLFTLEEITEDAPATLAAARAEQNI
jgi:hypothetical protein